MNKRKMIIIFVIVLLVLLVGLTIFYFINKSNTVNNEITEYTPQEEMSDDEMRKTIVSIYYKNIETNTLVPESVCIDVKELTENPYTKLLNLLLAGPSNSKLECPIPENTKINNTYLSGDIVYVDFSPEFINNAPSGIEEESLIIYSVVNTLTELNEVDGVKFLINGEDNLGFSDNSISFKDPFVRND